ncbi:MAG: DNA repair protein [Kangiellaceae bacterium]|nr:DNA repair protein [Kangiellaceae bacterium]|tara:strand:+ start:5098 stop:10410 length:5313 start_codon:yes stop_codon:yes gene_type:complete
MTDSEQKNNAVEQAVADGGAYEVIRQRLTSQGKALQDAAKSVNQARIDEFGSTEMSVLGRLRLRTEHNCLARDLVIVGDIVLLGYNVFMGLKKETRVEDVFALYRIQQNDDQFEAEAIDYQQSFLADQRFVSDFDELYAYYKDTQLVQLVVRDGKLLASFQIGQRLTDIRVFRWSLAPDGKVLEYIDNRGERDIALPNKFDFEWVASKREDVIDGRNPHVNILDTLFVDTLRGDLTVKVEDNTNTGQGIYSDPVDDSSQSLDDAEIHYASLGDLILLRIKPYQEQDYRYLVFNRNNESVTRIDAIGESCVQLPEDHGIIFPGGMYLATGEYKTFDDDVSNLKYKRVFRSPNGEDVLYMFYREEDGLGALYGYNLIEKSLQNPLFAHGYGFYEDGRLIIFYAETEATRVHPIQIWKTPYFSDEFAAAQPERQSFYGKIGNAELVRGISELYSLSRSVLEANVSSSHYNDLAKRCQKLFDAYHWLTSSQLDGIDDLVKQIGETAEMVLDEYEKVESIRAQSNKALQEAVAEQQEIQRHIDPDAWSSPNDFVQGLDRLRSQRGHLLTIREYRYMDIERIDALERQVIEWEEELNQATVDFLASDGALKQYYDDLAHVAKEAPSQQTVAELKPLVDILENMAAGLDLLSELMATLKVPDATLQTRIVDNISELYAKLNQQKAKLEHQRKSMGSAEAVAQFGAQFKLFGQSINNALSLASTPDKCDEQLSRLLVQLEELEGQFSDYDEFLGDILAKRDEVYETFEAHKQKLLEQRQRKCQNLFDAAERILNSIERRSQKFTDQDELNSFFASDGLVQKIRSMSKELRELDDSVKADDLESRLKSAKDNAVRSLRDKSDIYEDGGNIIKLGPRHKFSVNTQALDLTIVPRSDGLYSHLTGTDYFEYLDDADLNALKPYWDMSIPSESPEVYRAEYLAFKLLMAARDGEGRTLTELATLCSDEQKLAAAVRDFATPRYREGYEKGIHDHDAARILVPLVSSYQQAGPLRYDPTSRALAILFWLQYMESDATAGWEARARDGLKLAELFNSRKALERLQDEVYKALAAFAEEESIPVHTTQLRQASVYLAWELGQDIVSFATTKYASQLAEQFEMQLRSASGWDGFESALQNLASQPGKAWALAQNWLAAFVENTNNDSGHFIDEAVAIVIGDNRLSRTVVNVDLQLDIEQLLGSHPRLEDQCLRLTLDDFLLRLNKHIEDVEPGYYRFQDVRQLVIERERDALKLEAFKPRPLSSFVRNKLINDVYLPIIGDNLAKQMGTVGDSKRTDLMGLLLMISPPGYGKTTLMEYVASRLGLIFMKVNCPALGHDVTSVDPANAPNSTARQELEKLNLALEMGNNVMLYLDDIQHTHPEFLQKFISLCDGTRRIEGVWRGETKTYDMRGKKFCVVMAGNPYTESGETFKIPDMLANRADIYNLGDVLGGKEEVFALSYIENSLTSNNVLAPLGTRDMKDVYKFVALAQGEQVANSDFSHSYSGAEINEIKTVLQKMFAVRDVILKVNQQYIASSAQADDYRTEPPFKLQGSYRNMNKMAEKLSSVMTDDELMRVIADHYQGESQLLTAGAEENLLKLAELRGNMTDEEKARWDSIKTNFQRNKAMGGSDADVGTRVVGQLRDIASGLGELTKASLLQSKHASSDDGSAQWAQMIQPLLESQQQISALGEKINKAVGALQSMETPTPHIEVINQPVPGVDQILRTLSDTVQNSIQPLLRVMDGKLDLDLKTHTKMHEIDSALTGLRNIVNEEKKARKEREDKEA